MQGFFLCLCCFVRASGGGWWGKRWDGVQVTGAIAAIARVGVYCVYLCVFAAVLEKNVLGCSAACGEKGEKGGFCFCFILKPRSDRFWRPSELEPYESQMGDGFPLPIQFLLLCES